MENIQQMYNVIYDETVDAGIAVIMDTPVYMDHKGKEVSKSDRFGLEQNINITKPEYLLFCR